MRLSSCLWGGSLNPIIPVCKTRPKAWSIHPERITGAQITRGYLRFFEPDVFVEAAAGLAEEVGIEESGFGFHHQRVAQLYDFVSAEEGRRPQVTLGLEIFDLYRQLYRREFQFVARHEQGIALFDGRSRDDAFIEASFGRFSEDERLSHIEPGYVDAFDPMRLSITPANWLRVVNERLRGPLYFTRHSLEIEHSTWEGGPTIFIVDPSSWLDLIDLWNARLFRRSIIPVNVHWLDEMKPYLRDLVERTYRPLPGNPHGVMISSTVEFGRSIREDRAKAICKGTFDRLPKGSWAMKLWYDSIWYEDRSDMVARPQRARVSAAEANIELAAEGADRNTVRFQSLSPEFAERFGGRAARWANVLNLRDFRNRSGLALMMPSHLEDPHRSRIRLSEPLLSSREGLVLLQHFKDHGEYLQLTSGRDAIVGWLKRREIDAKPSDAGRVADQVITSLDGFWGAHILAHAETLKLLNKMAKSVRERPEGRVEEYSDRTAAVAAWDRLLGERASRGGLPTAKLDDFVKAGALRLGLTIRCTNCEKTNWYGLAELDSQVTCSRCLQVFDFPQGDLNFTNTPWHYRVAGPYSVPDFAGGAYATILALRTFSSLLGSGDGSITYSTNLDLELDGKSMEVDFVCWYRRKRMRERHEEPAVVVGEAKSFATDAIQKKDVDRMKTLAAKLPGVFIVFAVLKEQLSKTEKDLVSNLALWGRVPLADGRPRASVVVLTSNELFSEHNVSFAWKEIGGKHAKLVESASVWLDNLETLAECTQQLYLGLPDYWRWLGDRKKARKSRKKK